MSDFSSYEKMPKSLKKLNLSQRDYAELDKVQWVVTEKIHGANFSFILVMFSGPNREEVVFVKLARRLRNNHVFEGGGSQFHHFLAEVIQFSGTAILLIQLSY